MSLMSYKHLMLLLLETPENFQRVQTERAKWVYSRYPDRNIQKLHPVVVYKSNFTYETFLQAEIRILRDLVEPLREDWTSKPICLIDVEEVSMEKIDEFEGDVLADNEKRSVKLTSSHLLFDDKVFETRELRLQICKSI
ncbi:hypothetical protein M432DRAFT_639669 [Thermoascus aurantiacus ATCC 26904]